MKHDRAARRRLVGAALVLRDDVLRYLGSGADAPSVERLRMASAEAWSVLLRVECCALPLVARLRRDEALDQLGVDCRVRILDAEQVELQRVLAARSLIKELDVIAQRAGCRLTLLKGAAIAADAARQPLDLGDVDVLPAPGTAETMWDALRANGWATRFHGITPADGAGARAHFAPLHSARHLLPLEVHVRFDYGPTGAAARPLEFEPIAGYAALSRPIGAPALAATLRHSVVVHPHRRGHLRDLFLLAELLRELGPDDLENLVRDLEQDECDVELRSMLEQAGDLARGDAPIAEPPELRRFVVWKYATVMRTFPRWHGVLRNWTSMTYVPLERLPVRRAAYRRLLASTIEPVPVESSLRSAAWLRSRLGRRLGVLRVLRATYRSLLIGALVGIGSAVRRHVRALDAGIKMA